MKKYKLSDDGSFMEAATSLELVEKIRDSSKFASDETVEEYMEGFAKRQKEYSGDVIRATSAEDFIEDLIKIKFLISID